MGKQKYIVDPLDIDFHPARTGLYRLTTTSEGIFFSAFPATAVANNLHSTNDGIARRELLHR